MARSLRHAFLRSLVGVGLALAAGYAGSVEPLKVTDSTFKCLTEMTKVRHFFVDNIAGNLAATVKVAKAGKGEYPVGSVLQLVPNEVMVKMPKGFNPVTKDWEFFFQEVSPQGTKIVTRGFAEVNNGLGLNCFACHIKAKPEFDLVCDLNNGCDPIPITRPMLAAIQRSDPRCKNAAPLTPAEQEQMKLVPDAVKQLLEQRKGKA